MPVAAALLTGSSIPRAVEGQQATGAIVVSVTVRVCIDSTISIELARHLTSLDATVVSATRNNRRVEHTPIRVETIDGKEIAVKVTMSPGDIAMMLNEIGGVKFDW